MVQWFAKADRTLSSQPTALEVGVEVSGTHATGRAGTRELFSENTLTTLVFEDGVVVRLTAAVVDGQLLFLKHLDSQKEIVTRVLRQRSLGSANAYVELEFTEAAPGFWGAGLHLTGSDAAEISAMDAAAREFLAIDKPADGLLEPPAMPEERGVTPLLEEIATLRSQMGAMRETGALSPRVQPVAPPAVAAADMASVITTLLGAPPTSPEAPKAIDAEPRDEFSEGEESSSELSVEPPTGNPVTVRWRLIAALLALALVTGLAYQQGVLADWFGKRKLTVSAAGALDVSRDNSSASAQPRPVRTNSPAVVAEATPKSGNGEVVPTNVSMREVSGPEVAEPKVSGRDGSDPADAQQASDGVAGLNPEGNTALPIRGDHRPTTPGATDAAAVATSDAPEEAYEPPSLIKSVNAVPPPDALRDFVTGDVKCDALIDAAGKVASASVVSGPAALRDAALEALRGYQYKPASKNGQIVSAHVSVIVKFWYEP